MLFSTLAMNLGPHEDKWPECEIATRFDFIRLSLKCSNENHVGRRGIVSSLWKGCYGEHVSTFFCTPLYSMVGHSALVPPHGSTLIGVFCSRWPCALQGNGSAGASCRPAPDNARRVADGLNGTKTCSR